MGTNVQGAQIFRETPEWKEIQARDALGERITAHSVNEAKFFLPSSGNPDCSGLWDGTFLLLTCLAKIYWRQKHTKHEIRIISCKGKTGPSIKKDDRNSNIPL